MYILDNCSTVFVVDRLLSINHAMDRVGGYEDDRVVFHRTIQFESGLKRFIM